MTDKDLTNNAYTAVDNLGLPVNRKVTIFTEPTINPAFAKLRDENESGLTNTPENNSFIKEEITLSDDFFFMDQNDPDRPSKAYVNFRNRLFAPGSKVVKVEIVRPSGNVFEITINKGTLPTKQDQTIHYIMQALLMP